MKLAAQDLVKQLGTHRALDGVSFSTAEDARVVVLLGPSGGGKSTLLRVLGCLLVADSGSVSMNGKELPHNEKQAQQERRKNGFVFQGYNLFPHLTTLENVALPLREVHGLTASQAKTRAEEVLYRLGLAGQELKHPAAMSGGQQQRAAIARAIAPHPQLLLLDEPTSALDPVMTGEVLDVVLELAQKGQQIMLATHEVSFARKVADWVIFLAQGKVMESSPAEAFFNHPQHALAQEYLAGLSRYR
jgi:polar amino acid transport system ATP-binding protein